MQFAWFMEISHLEPLYISGSTREVLQTKTYMMTVKGFESDGKLSLGYCVTPLPEDVDIYDWHQDSIEWQANAVNYLVDGKTYASHTQYVPDKGMSFHNWVDNRNYSKSPKPANYPIKSAKSNYINSFKVSEMSLNNKSAKAEQLQEAPPAECGSTETLNRDVREVIQEIIK